MAAAQETNIESLRCAPEDYRPRTLFSDITTNKILRKIDDALQLAYRTEPDADTPASVVVSFEIDGDVDAKILGQHGSVRGLRPETVNRDSISHIYVPGCNLKLAADVGNVRKLGPKGNEHFTEITQPAQSVRAQLNNERIMDKRSKPGF